MNSSIRKHAADPIAILTSIPAALAWLAVVAFLSKWFYAWATGHLEPGSNTSLSALLLAFLVALLAFVGGACLTVRAWQGRSNRKWQIVSLVGSLLVLWAVSGG